MAMGDLAGHLHLEISTMTRVVDHLVADGLVTRVADANDRRVCRVQLTRKGRSLISKIRAELLTRYEAVLRGIPAQSREAVITTMSRLLRAFEERERCTCARPEITRRRRTGVG
jgi:DNA-binding MarR family transcriptional regulator